MVSEDIKDITIRLATTADVPDLVRLRRMMFEAMGYDDPAQLEASDAASEAYFGEAIPAGEFHGWLAVTSTGAAISSGGVVIDQHPHLLSPAALGNTYTTIFLNQKDPPPAIVYCSVGRVHLHCIRQVRTCRPQQTGSTHGQDYDPTPRSGKTGGQHRKTQVRPLLY